MKERRRNGSCSYPTPWPSQFFSFLSLCYDCLLFVTLKEKKKELVPLAISSGMLGFFKADSI